MTRVTFGVSASLFATNMSVKQNALDFAMNYALAVDAVNRAFYVDNGLTGANTKVAPIKQLTIPRLELCGVYLFAQLLHRVQQVFNLSRAQNICLD